MFLVLILLIVAAVMVGVGVWAFSQSGKNAAQGAVSSAASSKSPKKESSGLSFLRKLFQLLGMNGLGGGSEASSVQEFIPLDTIKDDMICVHSTLGVPYYRMMIECSSVNYELKTEEEAAEIESQFQGAITGWNFPWGIYVQTRRLDARQFVYDTYNDIVKTSQTYPALKEYGEQYYRYLNSTLTGPEQKLIVKRKYIIVECNDAGTQTDLDDKDKEEWASQKMRMECNNVISGLRRMGISGHICSTNKLIEIMFESMNKNEGGVIDGINTGEFMSGSVEGMQKDIAPDELSKIIHEFANQLDVCIMNHPDADPENKALAAKFRAEAVHMQQILENPDEY